MTEEINQKNNKKNPTASFGIAVKSWISMISGKGKAINTQDNSASGKNKENFDYEEDSVKEDIKKAQSYLSKWFSIFAQKSQPTIKSGKLSTEKAVLKAKEVVDVNFTKKVLKIFFVGVVFLIFITITLRLLGLSDNKEEDISNQGNVPLSPTLPPYDPIRPSIYADDKIIAAIEEDTRVLINEILGRNIKDESLNFPSIDTNISL